MSRGRWIASLAIGYHLVALAADTIPSPSQVRSARPPVSAQVSSEDPAYAVLAGAAGWVEGAASVLYPATRPVRRLTQPYVSAGLRQRWDMFSNPVRHDQYLRIDYWVASRTAQQVRVYRELVFPADREDRFRTRFDYRNKAISNVVALQWAQMAGEAEDPQAVAGANAMQRYFGQRMLRTRFGTDDRLLRVTAWYGMAPIAPPEIGRTGFRQQRMTALMRYFEGPVEVPLPRSRPQEGLQEQEADILWTVLFDAEQ